MFRIKFLVLCVVLAGCNKNDHAAVEPLPEPDRPVVPDIVPPVSETMADSWLGADKVIEVDENESVFITALNVPVDVNTVISMSFVVKPKDGAKAKALGFSFDIDDLDLTDDGVLLPVYGLYSNYTNTVGVTVKFRDGSIANTELSVFADLYQNREHKLESLSVLKAPSNVDTSFSYFAMQSKISQGMVIADVDGELRWVFNDPEDNTLRNRSGLFYKGEFVRQYRKGLYFQTLTGKQRYLPIIGDMDFITPHHEISEGKNGLLLNVSGYIAGERKREDVLLEVDPVTGTILKLWDMKDILKRVMIAGGEDYSQFLPTGVVRDWFHMNSALYDRSDDSIIISSRENFVIKIDYDTGNAKWVLGDETKLWGSYSSLRNIALEGASIPPIGQHSLSLDGKELLMFNNGHPSEHQPEGELTGQSLPTSLAMSYKIDEENGTASVGWQYDAGLKSNICSSVYRKGRDYLITYSSVDMYNPKSRHEIVQIVDESGEIKAEYKFPGMCLVWNTKIIDI